jgi:hypothetical protein
VVVPIRHLRRMGGECQCQERYFGAIQNYAGLVVPFRFTKGLGLELVSARKRVMIGHLCRWKAEDAMGWSGGQTAERAGQDRGQPNWSPVTPDPDNDRGRLSALRRPRSESRARRPRPEQFRIRGSGKIGPCR